MGTRYQGSCLCRRVLFEIDEFLPDAAYCHCSMCRKFHGAASAAFGSVSRSKFHWLQGEPDLKTYAAGNGTTRTFCSHCGSSLLFFSPNAPPDEIEIALGAMDSSLPVSPNAHIHVGSRGNWVTIDDDLVQYEAGRGSRELKK